MEAFSGFERASVVALPLGIVSSALEELRFAFHVDVHVRNAAVAAGKLKGELCAFAWKRHELEVFCNIDAVDLAIRDFEKR